MPDIYIVRLKNTLKAYFLHPKKSIPSLSICSYKGKIGNPKFTHSGKKVLIFATVDSTAYTKRYSCAIVCIVIVPVVACFQYFVRNN